MNESPTALDYLSRAGDILAETLGYVIVQAEDGDLMSERGLDAARRAIVAWHGLRAEVAPRTSPHAGQ